MSLWNRIRMAYRALTGDPALRTIFGEGPVASGVTVTADSAMGIAAVFACVRKVAETVGSLPCELHQRDSRDPAEGHSLYEILRWEPNPAMTAMSFWGTQLAHTLLRGNAYSFIQRTKGGGVAGLYPMNPDLVTPRWDKSVGYYYVVRNGTGQDTELEPSSVFHTRGLSSDGIVGYSPIRVARESLGLTIASERYGASFFGNSSRPSGVLQHPGALSPEASARIKKSWEEVHAGLDNAHRVAVLEEGMTWEKVGISPEDAQFLQTRKFQLAEVCRIFGVPPHIVGDLENASWATVEQQSIDFVVHCLGPWLVNLEQEIRRQLMTEADRRTLATSFRLDSLLRGDLAGRNANYATARQWGWMSINDVRRAEGMNPIPDGDDYLQPANMLPAGSPLPVSPVAAPKGQPDAAK